MFHPISLMVVPLQLERHFRRLHMEMNTIICFTLLRLAAVQYLVHVLLTLIEDPQRILIMKRTNTNGGRRLNGFGDGSSKALGFATFVHKLPDRTHCSFQFEFCTSPQTALGERWRTLVLEAYSFLHVSCCRRCADASYDIGTHGSFIR